MVLVDSSAWIEGFRRQGNLEVKLALEGLLDAYEAQVCAPVRLEVLGGASKTDRKTLGFYFAALPYRPCEHSDWERAIGLAWRLRDEGLSVPWLDIVISAMALHDQARVYTVDRHFAAIADKTGLELYVPGYGGSYRPR